MALVCALDSTFASSPKAETDIPPAFYELPTYTVRALPFETSSEAIPAAFQIVDQSAIQEATQQLSLDESLRAVPGVFILNPYNYAQDTRIAIRGFGSRANFGIRGIQLIVDGLPSTTPDGQGEVDSIDLNSAERIKVLRGPASGLYGASAGGVILIDTESGPQIPFSEIRLSAGSDGYFLGSAKTGGQDGKLNYLLSLNTLNYDGFRAHSRTEQTRFNSKISYQLGQGQRLTLINNHIDLPEQQDPGGLTREQAQREPESARARNVDFDSGESVVQNKIGIVYDGQITPHSGLQLVGYYISRDFENRLPFTSGGQVTLDRSVSGIHTTFHQRYDSLNTTLGLSFDQQRDERKNFDNLFGQRGSLQLDQREEVKNFAVFAGAEYKVLPTLIASGALRYDQIDFEVTDHFFDDGDDTGSVEFEQLSPLLGITWKPHSSISLYANASTTFETPTTTELDNPNGGGFNQGLDSQTSTNLELGLRGEFDSWGIPAVFDLAIFRIETKDTLVSFELPTSPGRSFFRNAGSDRRYGLEGNLSLEISKALSANISYTWSDFKYQSFNDGVNDFSGNQLPGIPEHQAYFELAYNNKNGLFAKAIARFVGSLYADDANNAEVDQSLISDIRIGWRKQIGNWTIVPFGGINNLFDTNYFGNIRINAFGGRFFEPAPPRNGYAGIRVNYQFK